MRLRTFSNSEQLFEKAIRKKKKRREYMEWRSLSERIAPISRDEISVMDVAASIENARKSTELSLPENFRHPSDKK